MGHFAVYITTNPKQTTLYIGMTNDLRSRIVEHYLNRGKPKTFAGRYYCYCLIYYESYDTALEAIDREKELKKWSRKKKEALIEQFNQNRWFLNNEIMPWPPEEGVTAR